MKRIFIYTDEKSNKFWTIEVNGNSYTVNYGKAGTAGQTQTKDFADETACQKAADKLIAEKTKKGYVEQSGESEDTTENKSSKVLKEIIVEADTFSGYAYLVDLDDKESINNTLNAVIKHLDSDEVMERIENDDFLYPEYGQMEDDEFVEHESHPYRSSEDRFFSEAASYPELRPLVVKYVKKIIKLNDEHDTVWANDETQAGVNAVFNLIEASEEYMPLYIDLIRSCSDGEHDVYQFEHAQTILEKYGWKAETLPVIIQRVLVDIYASEFFKTDAAKEFLSKEENINLLIKAFFKEVQGTHYSRNDFHFKVLAKFVFSDKAEEYGELLYDYSQKGKTPTVVLLKKGANVINSSKKVKYNYRDYKERINTALRNLGLKELGNDCRCSSKLTESDNMEFGAQFGINEKEP